MDTFAVESSQQSHDQYALIANALGALRRGDTSFRLPDNWLGEQGRIASEFNALALQTARMSQDLGRISQRLPGGGADAQGAAVNSESLAGAWLDSATHVNALFESAKTGHECTKAILAGLTALQKGEVAALPPDWTGVQGKLSHVFNDVVEQNVRMSEELGRLSRVVGKEGRLKERAALPYARGFWGDSIEAVNSLIADLVHPTSEVARVIGAVAQGDLSKSMALEAEGRALQGEFLRTAKTINTMVEQLGTFAAEVTRVAREVGTEGKLGGQADVQGVAGTWKDLTDSVNSMAGNLTSQVRNIAEVTKAVAAGDLSKKIT
jgi:HAMP domain-containing protein